MGSNVLIDRESIDMSFMVNGRRPINELILAGKYDHLDHDINENNFHLEERRRKIRLGFKLFNFNRPISSKNIISQMAKRGYRPSGVEEILLFGELRPDFQRYHPIVALNAIFTDSKMYSRVIVLSGDLSRRYIYLAWLGTQWETRYRFLGIKEK